MASPASVFPALAGLPAPRRVAFSAFRAGGLVGLGLRASARSRSGFVVVAWFRPGRGAAPFARRWASRLGVSVVVRQRGAFLAVSVPILSSIT